MANLENFTPTIDPDSSENYFNRELSWLDFNSRVLDEAMALDKPLLERVKFLSIFSSNLDEFFMVRVSGLRRQLESGTLSAPPDGMTPSEQLAAIRERLLPELQRRTQAWTSDLQPVLAEAGIHVHDFESLKKKQRKLLRAEFKKEIFPILTPLAVDLSHPFPHISNRSINLAVVIRDPAHGERFARVKVPHTMSRLHRIPSEERAEDPRRLGLENDREAHFVWLEQIVSANLDHLFPGLEVVAAHPFRVTRDADQDIEEDEAADLMTAMQEFVDQRHFGSVIRLEVDGKMPESIRTILIKNLGLAPYQVFDVEGPLALSDILELSSLDRPELKDAPFLPAFPTDMTGEVDVFHVIRSRDALLYHPYDSFRPVVDFVAQAAADPQVVAIKQCLYRVGLNSPIVDSLMEARENGKQVSAIVELRARFDEEKNIVWARALEQVGVHVVYGVHDLKVHSKMCMIVRKEGDGIRRYVHIGTGNYNTVTTRIYTDLGLFTADPEIVADVSDLFNALTGYSLKSDYRKLLVSPHSMRRQLIEKIEREVKRHLETGRGHLAFKMNSLVDKELIMNLYRASASGVRIDLQVRGICCLRPGVPQLSETITVTSIVGRFLEHSRIYYFHNGGDEELYIGSADLMPRNLDGRVEVLVPIDDQRLKASLRDDVLFLHLADNVQARKLRPDGSYSREIPQQSDQRIDSQRQLLERNGPWLAED